MAQSGYTPILIYASGTAAAVPSAVNLTSSASGAELALNYADGKLYYKDSGGSVQLLATKAGASGDVVGPASSTDNALARFDSTTGKLIQNSVAILSDTGALSGITTLTASADSSFTSTGALLISKGTTGQQPGSPATGMMRYNSTTNQFEGYSGASPAWKSIGGSALSNDTSTTSNLYPVFAGATSGTAENLYTSNAQYLFKPSTGELSVKAPRASNGIVVNSATISSDYTIATGDNGGSFGPVAVDSGVTVTVSSGSTWTVV
jgi:hypothetical protein